MLVLNCLFEVSLFRFSAKSIKKKKKKEKKEKKKERPSNTGDAFLLHFVLILLPSSCTCTGSNLFAFSTIIQLCSYCLNCANPWIECSLLAPQIFYYEQVFVSPRNRSTNLPPVLPVVAVHACVLGKDG